MGVEGSIPFSSTIFRFCFGFREKWHLNPGIEPAPGADEQEEEGDLVVAPVPDENRSLGYLIADPTVSFVG